MGVEELLDLRHRHLLAAPVDDVLHPSGDADVATRVDPGQVTGAVPAVGREGLGGQLRTIQVAVEQAIGVDLEVALLATGQLPALVVDHAQAHVCQRAAVGPPGSLGRIAGRERAAQAALGRSPGAAHLGTQYRPGAAGELAGDRRARGHERLQVLGCFAALLRHPGQVGQERRGRLHERDAEAAHRVEADVRVPHLLEDLRDAQPERDPHPVQEAGLVGQGRGHVDHVVGAQPKVLDVVIGGAVQHVVAVQSALRLTRGARREQQLGDLIAGQGGEAGGPSAVEQLAVPVGRLGVPVGQLAVPVEQLAVPVEQLAVPVGQHDDVLESWQRRAQTFGHRTMVATPVFPRHEQHAGAALAQHERELALAEDRHQRLAHRAGPQRAQRDRDELEAVGELESHRLALEYAEQEQRCCDPVGVVSQSSPGQLAHRTVGADLHDRPPARPLAGVPVEVVEDHRACSSAGTARDTAAGIPRRFMWSRNSG